MVYDEHEMLIEYSEMTSFNFNSKEFQEVRQDFIECKKNIRGFEWFVKNLLSKFKKAEYV